MRARLRSRVLLNLLLERLVGLASYHALADGAALLNLSLLQPPLFEALGMKCMLTVRDYANRQSNAKLILANHTAFLTVLYDLMAVHLLWKNVEQRCDLLL